MGKGDAKLEHVGSLHGRLVQVEAWSSGLGKQADVGRACRDVWCRSACVGCLLGHCQGMWVARPFDAPLGFDGKPGLPMVLLAWAHTRLWAFACQLGPWLGCSGWLAWAC